MRRAIVGLACMMAAAASAVAASPVRVEGGTPERLLLMWSPGEVRCSEGGLVRGERMPRPLNGLVWSTGVAAVPITFAFAIDEGGRPISIARRGEGNMAHAEDTGPALAASRFAPGAIRSDCTITYTPRTAPLDAAPVPELMSYSMNRKSIRLPREAMRRIGGGNCGERPVPGPLLRAYPDFRKLANTPGRRDWAMVGYDLDASGRPVNVRIVGGTGHAALDAASLDAVGKSRFASGEREGCRYPYWLNPGVVEAPPMPPKGALEPADAACDARDGFARPPRLIFPEPYRRRAIEGWAIVSYDVASWGEIGNVKVLEAQPSEDFGKQAVRMMENAEARTSGQGMTGCVDRIRFVMNAPRPEPEEDSGDDRTIVLTP